MKKVETGIQIQASPEKVWSVFSDTARWSEWNPFITKFDGALNPGSGISVTLELPGERLMTIKPRVLAVEPSRELRWKGKLLIPGIFDGEHYFQLSPENGGTCFTHCEIFGGILIGILDMNKVKQAFEAMNEALKKRVEA